MEWGSGIHERWLENMFLNTTGGGNVSYHRHREDFIKKEGCGKYKQRKRKRLYLKKNSSIKPQNRTSKCSRQFTAWPWVCCNISVHTSDQYEQQLLEAVP